MFNSEASFRNPSEKPRSGEMSIEGLRCSCSFRSATDYRSPINGLSEINRFELFYKHCIPTGFPDRLLKQGMNESYLLKLLGFFFMDLTRTIADAMILNHI